MATNLSVNKTTRYFAASVSDKMPYLKANRSYIPKGDLVGKKAGLTYRFYIPDVGYAEAGSSDASIEGMPAETQEREISVTLRLGKARVDLGAFERLTGIDDFVKEIAAPRGRKLAAKMEKDVINRNWLISDGAVVVGKTTGVSDLNMSLFGTLGANLRAVKADGKMVGFAHPNIFSTLSQKNLYAFLPEGIQKKVFADAWVGRFNTVEWIEDTYMPIVTAGASTPTITAANLDTGVITGTNLYDGCAFQVAGYYCVDLNCETLVEPKTFFLTGTNAGGTSANLSYPVICATNGETVNTNCNCSGDAVALATAMTTPTFLLTNGKRYYVVQARDNDALELDMYPLPETPGCETSKQKVGDITVESRVWTDVKTLVAIRRYDVPYIADIIDSRLARVGFVEV